MAKDLGMQICQTHQFFNSQRGGQRLLLALIAAMQLMCASTEEQVNNSAILVPLSVRHAGLRRMGANHH